MSEAEEIQEEVTVDPVESAAREQGWVSKDEFDANPENEGKTWRPAREFNERGEFIGEITGLKRQLDDIKKATRDLLKSEREAVRKQTEERVRAELAQAVEDGDPVKAQKAADDLKDLNTPDIAPDAEAAQNAFVERNPWYGDDPERTAYAEALDRRYFKPGADLNEHFKRIEDELQKRFPEKYEKTNPNRERAPTAEATTTKRRSGSRVPALSSLPEQFQNAGRKFVKQGLYKDEAEYVKELVDQGVIDA